jgi:hypothetical protein
MESLSFIQEKLNTHSTEFIQFVNERNQIQFTSTPNGKWSVGQNIDHLIKSIRPVNLALRLPRFVLRLLFGKPNRKPRTYAALVDRYKEKLAAGGTATGAFIPPTITWAEKDKLVSRLSKEVKVMNNLMTTWTEEQLDQYLLPHPLLGKLTLREMLFFTVYHIQHHHTLLRERNE